MKKFLAIAVLALAMPGIAGAATYTWDFNTPSGVVAPPHTYLDNTLTYSIVANGYLTTDASPLNSTPGLALGQTWAPGGTYDTGTTTLHGLFGKNDGPGETGLGLDETGTSDGNNEAFNTSFIQLDLENLLVSGATDMTAIISSIQDTESFQLYGSNTAGVPGTLLYIGTSAGGVTQSILVPSFGTYRYISLTSPTGDTLFENGLTSTVPNVGVPLPTALSSGLALSGALAAFFAIRRGVARMAHA